MINKNKKLNNKEKLFGVYNELKVVKANSKYTSRQLLNLASRAIRYFEIEEDQIDYSMIKERKPKPNYFTYDLVDAFTNRQYEILSMESKLYKIYG